MVDLEFQASQAGINSGTLSQKKKEKTKNRLSCNRSVSGNYLIIIIKKACLLL